MYLRDLVPIDEYNEMVETGYITVRKHPDYELYISNYSPTAQFEQKWIPSVMYSRGLITDNHDRIIARPWSKFFNLGEKNMICGFDDPVEVMDKLDGSLGILYPTPDGTYAIATRGAFASPQAIHATEVWKNVYAAHYDSTLHAADSAAWEYTFLFEIIYPENQIVLDYKGMDDLVLLGAVHRENGYYLGPIGAKGVLGWYGPVAEVLPHKTISEAIIDSARPNAEGFVVRYHNSLVKIKQPDYLDKHKLRFELTPKRIWEHVSKGTDMVAMVKELPDEFQREIIQMSDEFTLKAGNLLMDITEYWLTKVDHNAPRADIARSIKDYEHKAAIFTMLDDKDVMDYVWNAVKPEGQRQDTHREKK